MNPYRIIQDKIMTLDPEDKLLATMELEEYYGLAKYSNNDIKKAKALRKKMRRKRFKSGRN